MIGYAVSNIHVLCAQGFPAVLDTHVGVQLLSHLLTVCRHEAWYTLLCRALHHVTFPPARQEGSRSSRSSPALGMVHLFFFFVILLVQSVVLMCLLYQQMIVSILKTSLCIWRYVC